jgi:4-aminobutyrate aminotransferase-like enzyme
MPDDSPHVPLPTVLTPLPGPRSSELLARKDRLFCGPLRDIDEVPFVMARKSDWLIEDVDGNTFADHVAAWGSTPLGARAAAAVAPPPARTPSRAWRSPTTS